MTKVQKLIKLKIMKKDFNLILSSISLIYFASLIYISMKQILLNDILEAVFEFSTIPFIALVAVLAFLSIKSWRSENWEISSKSFFSVLIITITLVLIVVASVFNV